MHMYLDFLFLSWWPFLSHHAFLFNPLVKVVDKFKVKAYASPMTFISKSHISRPDMSQFSPPCCKRKRGTQKVTFLKQNKAIRPGMRAEGCFLRCCWSLVFFCWCCVLALTALRQLSPPLPAKRNSPNSSD